MLFPSWPLDPDGKKKKIKGVKNEEGFFFWAREKKEKEGFLSPQRGIERERENDAFLSLWKLRGFPVSVARVINGVFSIDYPDEEGSSPIQYSFSLYHDVNHNQRKTFSQIYGVFVMTNDIRVEKEGIGLRRQENRGKMMSSKASNQKLWHSLILQSSFRSKK